MGKDLINNDNTKMEYFNVSKAINFCVDMFETKKSYDNSKKSLEIYSDINFSYDKMVNSISETGFKMVLINLLTNSYKFTIKGHIVVRAVSMPKEKKIRILVKDSGKGFNPKEFKKNGCFYVYERNQDLNADGSGLGLSIVNEILTKFNIKLDCISDSEKGGSLFYFDIEDSFPYYDEIIPQNLMTDSLNQIINDINTGKQNKVLVSKPGFNKSKKKSSRKSIPNYQFQIQLKKIENSKRNSFMEDNIDLNKNNISTPFKNTNEKNVKNNNNINIKNIKKNHLFVVENVQQKKRKSFGDFPTNNINNINNESNFKMSINTTPNKNKIARFYSFENNFKLYLNSVIKKNGQANILKQIIEDNNLNRRRSFKEEKENEKNKNPNDKNNVNYKKLLNKNFNKSKFYLFDIRNIFLKNEIYINVYQKSLKRCQTETKTPRYSTKNKNNKINNHISNKNKIYIIICDDEEFVAMSAKQLIIKYYLKQGKEPHVYFTPNGIECIYLMYKLYIIENKKIEYILLDMEMPYLNGINTCNIIKSIKETNVPIYILSGDEPKDCTADGYCNKPLNEIDIINKLDRKLIL
jgi:CheY-like chemotaxis protein